MYSLLVVVDCLAHFLELPAPVATAAAPTAEATREPGVILAVIANPSAAVRLKLVAVIAFDWIVHSQILEAFHRWLSN